MIARTLTPFVLLLVLLPAQGMADTMANFPVPPRTDVWWTSRGDVHNGQPVFIKKFKSQLDRDNVADFYRRVWHRDDGVRGYIERQESGWLLISHLKADYQWVVQIKPDESGQASEGFLSAMKWLGTAKRPRSAAARHGRFTPVLRGGELVSSTDSNDPQPARTQLHLYPDRPARVAERFKRFMTSEGWSMQDEFTHRGSLTQRYEKAKHQLDVALVAHRGNQSLVFLNEVHRGEK